MRRGGNTGLEVQRNEQIMYLHGRGGQQSLQFNRGSSDFFFTACLEVALHFGTLRPCEDILLAAALEQRA